MSICETSITNPKKQLDFYKDISEQLEKENRELKEQLEVGEQQYNDLVEEKEELQEQLSNSHQIKTKQKEFIEYLEAEKNRLSRECSQIYEDSLGKIRLISEDIFNEVDKILSKYKEIIGGSDGES